MKTFYVYHEVEGFEEFCNEVEANDESEAAVKEASRAFDEAGVDPMRPVEVIVARSRKGAGAMRFEVRREVTITHNIISEREIDIESDDEEDDHADED